MTELIKHGKDQSDTLNDRLSAALMVDSTESSERV